MPRIYLSVFTSLLPAKQAQHVRVLRLKMGDTLELFDGKGQYAQATLTHSDKKAVEVDIATAKMAEKPKTFPIHLAISSIQTMDFAIQKAVELGVSEITPILAERCQGRLRAEQLEKKRSHWQEIMIAACEQSGLNFLPLLHPITPLEDFVSSPQGMKLMCDPAAIKTIKDIPPGSATTATLLLGPEGGFSKAEISTAANAGFLGIRLHAQILRAETAAIAATSIVQFYFGQK